MPPPEPTYVAIASAVAWLTIPDTRASGVSAVAAAAAPPFAAQIRLLTAHAGFLLVSLVGFMNVLKLEGARDGILVNTIAPIATTRMTEAGYPKEFLNSLKPEHVSAAVARVAGSHRHSQDSRRRCYSRRRSRLTSIET